MSTATAATASAPTPTSQAELDARKSKPAGKPSAPAVSAMSIEDRVAELERVVAILRVSHRAMTGTVISTVGSPASKNYKPKE